MQRRASIVVLFLMIIGLASGFPQAAVAKGLAGLPSDTETAKITGYNDGDKFEVSVGGETKEVNLLGADAPELDNGDLGECFAKEAKDYVAKLLKKNQTVYLEKDSDDKDGKDRLLRYVWAANSKGDKAYMVNELMISKGYAQFKSRDGDTKHDGRFEKAQSSAKRNKAGLWGACAGPHSEITPVPKVGTGDNPAALGVAVEGDGRSIVVNSASFYDSYGYFAPAQNRIFLIINVTMTNISTSGKQHSYNELCFAAKDLDTGNDYDDAIFNASDNPLGAGDMNPGETVSGDVTIEVAPTVTNIRIKYSTGDTFCSGGSSLYWIVTR